MAALAEKRFILESKNMRFDHTLKLCESGAFAYGNQHSLLLICNNKDGHYEPQLFDARYDPRFNTVESFNENALSFMKEWSDPSFTVTEVTP